MIRSHRVMRIAAAVLKHLLLRSGIYDTLLRRTRFPGVCVLCYHGVRPDDWPVGTMPFEGLHVRASELSSHLLLLRRTCHLITLGKWRSALAGGPPLPPRSVLVTFDDGYRNTVQFGLPILRELKVPGVLFVCTDPVANQRSFWPDAVARAQGEDAVGRLKTIAYDEWKRETERCAVSVADTDRCAPMLPEDARRWADTFGCEVGAHTATHPILSHASREQQLWELQRSKSTLEEWTGRQVTAFAYPNGAPGVDYGPDTVELVGEVGFDIAFNTRSRFALDSEPPLERSRFIVLAGMSAAELAHRLCSSWRRSGGDPSMRST